MAHDHLNWSDVTREVAAVSHVDGSGADPTITGIEYDSRRVTAGSIFVAMRGGSTDGNRYIAAVLAQQAAGIVTDSPEAFKQLGVDHPQTPRLLVAHGRQALAELSSAFFGHPERQLRSTAVTGTNGKTTTSFLIESLLNAAGHATVLVGTIEYHVAGHLRPSPHTTPESRDLFELMAEGVQHGATEMVMEVSSHALDQGRVASVGFDVAVFTNLTRDHLDYHGSMEKYFTAKRLLFDGLRYPAPRVAVLNASDPHADILALVAADAGSHVVRYGIGDHVHCAAEWRAEHLHLLPGGVEFTLAAPDGIARVTSALAGEVNVLNLLAALAAARARGVPFDTLLWAIPSLRPVPGRFQPVNAGQPFTVIVDYAHTDDALRNLTALAGRMLARTEGSSDPNQQRHTGRVITVFGCGGDRDRTKRPLMGRAAGEGSAFVVVTSDNPRSEDPQDIIEEILPGVRLTNVRYAVEPDRAKAIALALAEAAPGDIVLIAGKGHEKEQILRDGPIFFDDAQVALSALRAQGWSNSAEEADRSA